MSRSSAAAVLRIGRRSIGRSRGRSLLIVLLVLLPVAAMAGAITLIATVSPTAEETATHRMGIAGYEVQEAGSLTTDELRALLPDGAQVEPWSYDVAPLVLPGRTITVNAWSMDLNGLARGKVVVTTGRPPQNQHEVSVSAGLAKLAGVAVGDSITLQGRGTPTVVGMVEDPFDINGRLVLLDASVARESAASADRGGASPVWLVSIPDGSQLNTSPDACERQGCQFVAYSRYQFPTTSDDTSSAIMVLGGLALVEAILIAAAAFTVSIRRRQRELGLMAAAGAERRHLAGTVLSEGVFLGGVAAVFGIVLGVLGVVALSPWLDQLTNRRIGPVVISVAALLLAGGIGLAACLLAAWLPARAAARLPVLMALSGRRPPLSPARRLLVVGLVMVVIGALLTSTGAAMRLTDAGGSLSLVMLLVGAIVSVLGFGACSPWLIERLERLGLRLPVAARIALRDTARARSRNAPIVTAILAAFAATVAVSSYFASNDAAAAAHWQPWLRSDQIIVQGEGADRAGAAAAQALGAKAGAPMPWLVGSSNGGDVFATVDDSATGEGWTLTIGDAELLNALGAEGAQKTLDEGGVVLMSDTSRPMPMATIVVHGGSTGGELQSATLPAMTVGAGLDGGGRSDAVISAATAQRLGLAAGQASTYLIRLSRPVVDADVALAATFAAQESNTTADASLGPTRPDQLFRIVLVILSLLFALSVTGIAVALGEAESRHDQRTLLSIGADPGIRRRIAAGRAGVLALMAGLLAVPAGLVPAWGLLGSRGAPLVVPLPEVVAAVIILPLAGIVGALLLSRRIPEWSALREAGS